MSESNASEDGRKRIQLCDWNEAIHAKAVNKQDHYSIKALCRGKQTETDIARKAGLDPSDIERVLVAIGNAVHEGYDVELCGAVRFYACVLKLETPCIVAQTMGNFRRSVADKAIRPTVKGEETTVEAVKELDSKARKECPHITPDRMIVCPVCGSNLRVGKVLK